MQARGNEILVTLTVVALCAALGGCGKSTITTSSAGKGTGGGGDLDPYALKLDQIAAQTQVPSSGVLTLGGDTIADLSQASTVSPYGTVNRGQTLNYITIDSQTFLVYGEDGVFAAECEPSVDYPDHGPAHPKCQVAHAESFDTIILCTSTFAGTPLAQAQMWNGAVTAMTGQDGMTCWKDGVKMLSNRVFTY
jgi:hypothetical protein